MIQHDVQPTVNYQLSTVNLERQIICRIILYRVSLPEETASFSSYQKVRIDELEQYAVPKLIHAFLEKYV